jgi:predicted anti-sigma-YlaC factor YlaD
VTDCAQVQEAISALADGEDPGLDPSLVEAHVATCPSCRSQREFIHGLRRSKLREAETQDDMAPAVVRSARMLDGVWTWTFPRGVLAICAVVIALTSFGDLLGGSEIDGHDARHLGAFSLAYVIALGVVVVRPARARTVLPISVVVTAALVITAVIDVADGAVSLSRELSHTPEIISLIAVWALITALPGSPFIDPEAEPAQRFNPLYKSLAAFFALIFFMSGAAFGIGARSVTSHRDLVRMMREGIVQLAPYLVLVFFAAHFVAMFNWSGLGPILAIHAAEQLRQINMPAPLLLISVVLVSCFFDLFVGSASAKWSALAPIVVPMFMLLGISPEMTTAAYRMGDSVTNIATPLMSYFPLILTFAQRWDPRFGLGSLMSTMLPYAGAFLIAGLSMVALWVALDLPLGPGVGVHYSAPPPAVAVQLPVDGGITGPVAPPEAAAVAGPGVPKR